MCKNFNDFGRNFLMNIYSQVRSLIRFILNIRIFFTLTLDKREKTSQKKTEYTQSALRYYIKLCLNQKFGKKQAQLFQFSFIVNFIKCFLDDFEMNHFYQRWIVFFFLLLLLLSNMLAYT